MLVDEFDYQLPPSLIADHPADKRDGARMMVVKNADIANGREVISDSHICDLPSILESGDLMVFNNTRVIPARLFGRRRDAKVEVTLHKRHYDTVWDAFAKPARRLKIGDIFHISDSFQATVTAKGDNGEVTLAFTCKHDEFYSLLQKHGHMPLPPYISRKDGLRDTDNSDYQTIFSQEDGAVAAPTAGLHFTKELFDKLKEHGIKHTFLTLHVGAGTFLPVKVEDTENHKMHSEFCTISQETVDAINATKKAGGRVISVGTTALRTLETAVQKDGTLQPFEGNTDIFITPGYDFKTADILLTNFHLPRSTLFMLVSAFSGMDQIRNAYQHAIADKYRFYSYGDATLLYRKTG